MEYLKEFVITLTTISIFIVAIELILPDNSLKKYQNFVLSLIMMSVILTPIIKLFNSNVSVAREIEKTINEVKQSYNEQDESFYDFNESTEFIISRLEENCKLLLEDKFNNENTFDVKIDGEVNLNTYEIDVKNVIVKISELKESENIEKVEITKNNDDEELNAEIIKKIKSILGEELKIDQNIVDVIKGEELYGQR